MLDRVRGGSPLFQVGDELAEEFLRAIQLETQGSPDAQVLVEGLTQPAHSASCDPGQGRARPRNPSVSTLR
jgi:hypothetical protein